MPAIIFNYNFCDNAPECGGIEACPKKAIFFNQELGRPDWDKSKCEFCLRCTLPNVCPIGCILYARTDEDEAKIREMVKLDPQKRDWLWQERYGVDHGQTAPLVLDMNGENYQSKIASETPVLIDVWLNESTECRLHSPLYSELVEDLSAVTIYKVNAAENDQLVKSWQVTTFPTLLVFKAGNEIGRIEGFLNTPELIETAKQNIVAIL